MLRIEVLEGVVVTRKISRWAGRWQMQPLHQSLTTNQLTLWSENLTCNKVDHGKFLEEWTSTRRTWPKMRAAQSRA